VARAFNHPSPKDITLDGVLHALADPVRRGIVVKLRGCESMSCSKACDAIPASTISFHHKVLRETGLIRSEKRGVEVINSIREQELEKRFPGLLSTILELHRPKKNKQTSKQLGLRTNLKK
jgi:DNA-binding transcriptional ArsR family regulator